MTANINIPFRKVKRPLVEETRDQLEDPGQPLRVRASQDTLEEKMQRNLWLIDKISQKKIEREKYLKDLGAEEDQEQEKRQVLTEEINQLQEQKARIKSDIALLKATTRTQQWELFKLYQKEYLSLKGLKEWWVVYKLERRIDKARKLREQKKRLELQIDQAKEKKQACQKNRELLDCDRDNWQKKKLNDEKRLARHKNALNQQELELSSLDAEYKVAASNLAEAGQILEQANKRLLEEEKTFSGQKKAYQEWQEKLEQETMAVREKVAVGTERRNTDIEEAKKALQESKQALQDITKKTESLIKDNQALSEKIEDIKKNRSNQEQEKQRASLEAMEKDQVLTDEKKKLQDEKDQLDYQIKEESKVAKQLEKERLKKERLAAKQSPKIN